MSRSVMKVYIPEPGGSSLATTWSSPRYGSSPTGKTIGTVPSMCFGLEGSIETFDFVVRAGASTGGGSQTISRGRDPPVAGEAERDRSGPLRDQRFEYCGRRRALRSVSS